MTNTASTQHAYSFTSSIADQLENTIDALRALEFLLHEAMFSGVSFKNASAGISVLIKQQLNDLSEIRTATVAEFNKLTIQVTQQSSRHLVSIDKDVRHHISRMIISAREEAKTDTIDDDNVSLILKYYGMLIEKLDGESELLVVGSMFPWLEMQIRKDFGLSISGLADKKVSQSIEDWSAPRNLRNEFIVEKLQQGFSLQHISQALNIRVSAIEKAMAKLADKDQDFKEITAA